MEKRLHPRKDSNLFIRYQTPGAAVSWSGFTKNISQGGARILSGESFPPSSKLDVTIDLPGAIDYFYTEAEVRWVAAAAKAPRTGSPTYHMGLMFTHSDPEDQNELQQFLGAQDRK